MVSKAIVTDIQFPEHHASQDQAPVDPAVSQGWMSRGDMTFAEGVLALRKIVLKFAKLNQAHIDGGRNLINFNFY